MILQKQWPLCEPGALSFLTPLDPAPFTTYPATAVCQLPLSPPNELRCSSQKFAGLETDSKWLGHWSDGIELNVGNSPHLSDSKALVLCNCASHEIKIA